MDSISHHGVSIYSGSPPPTQREEEEADYPTGQFFHSPLVKNGRERRRERRGRSVGEEEIMAEEREREGREGNESAAVSDVDNQDHLILLLLSRYTYYSSKYEERL